MQPAAIFSLYAFFLCSSLLYCSARDTITFNNSITDKSGETLVSVRESFELGFFTPNGSSSSKRYVGIWYNNITPQTVVWVANRDRPLHDRGGSFGITDDGSLKVFDGKGNLHWSEAHESPSFKKTTAMLMDSGNLILRDAITEKILWESFRNPTDTFLPGMKMDEDLQLTSWTSGDDPAKGNFTFGTDQSATNQFIIRKNESIPYWTSEHDQIPESVSDLLASNFSKNVSVGPCGRAFGLSCLPSPNSGNYTKSSNFRRLVISFSGEIEYYLRWDVEKNWFLLWKAPRERCVVGLNRCGNYSICNKKSAVECKCLNGFKPLSPASWNFGYFSDGCERETPISCGKETQIDTFASLKNMKVADPDGRSKAMDETDCKTSFCLRNCMCQAYSYNESNGNDTCLIWIKGLGNLQEEYAGGRTLCLRVSGKASEAPSPMKTPTKMSPRKTPTKMSLPVIIALTIPTVIILIASSYLRRRVAKRRENRADFQQNAELHLYDTERRIKNLIDSNQFSEEDKKDIDVPFFDLESIITATDNFSNANKLGKGGFGPVYKGKFPGGREFAVKRLSSVSGQGLEEFKNEVVLISKLQHRNLVRLLGYYIKGEEKMLLYEYMPNKSLDSFIFDRKSSVLLDWELRFKIILGIARGLLYLHEDSRLRIIHRDLKTSNILLDEEMSPKIADFGLARMFGGKQTEGNTNKVVGTYGYMSPEYALDGFFSVKSDVFSFGVVVLEIISGIRNTGFYQSEQALSLLGYAWRLWNEDKALDLMDQTVCETCNTNEFLKCMNVGLLCVQDDPSDRPTMSNAVAMLVSETAILPTPKQPAFLSRRDPSTTASSSSKPEICSINELTVTVEQGR